jgi:2-polyprenyl-3-methyl-5-hydroxy-6-metoxy-1,4-benzoquinol methylase
VTMTLPPEPQTAVIGTACLACGEQAWAPQFTGLVDYLTGDIFDIQCCRRCGLLITDPLPQGQAIGKYYPQRYRGNRHSFTGSMRCALRRRMIEACFPAGFRGKILDIGCGDGSFAVHMKSRGWDVAATEIDSATIDRLRQAGIDAKLSGTADAEGFDRKFDAITCWHVLEHMESPRCVVDWVKTQLKAGGFFQTSVPNVTSLQASVFGRKWIHLDVPRHRQHFTPVTLASLLKQGGFTIERQSNFALEYDWLGVIQSALNVICTKPNVLFERLINSPKDDIRRSSVTDKFWTVLFTPPIALVSLPVIVGLAACGDGATLTLTCRGDSVAE